MPSSCWARNCCCREDALELPWAPPLLSSIGSRGGAAAAPPAVAPVNDNNPVLVGREATEQVGVREAKVRLCKPLRIQVYRQILPGLCIEQSSDPADNFPRCHTGSLRFLGWRYACR